MVQPIIRAITDGLKVQEYATAYGTGVAGLLFNKIHEPEAVERITHRPGENVDGPVLGTVPMDEAAREGCKWGQPLLAHAPESEAARGFADAAAGTDVADTDADEFAERFRTTVIPEA